MYYFGRFQSLQFGLEGGVGVHFRGPKIARSEVNHRQAKNLPLLAQGGEIIVAFGSENLLIEVRTRAENLRHLAVDQFAWYRLLGLLAHGHLAAGLQQLADVVVRGMKRNAAHWGAAAFS